MKTQILFKSIVALALALAMAMANKPAHAQKIVNILDQNITIYSEDEPLTDVIKKICAQFNLDYDYNSKLIKGKRVSLNVSNKSVSEVLQKLMDDFYLIFEIENNMLIVRDYVPMSKSKSLDHLYSEPVAGFRFENPKRSSVSFKFRQISNLIILPVSINGSDSLNFILDTGLKGIIITELTMVNQLNLNYMKPISLHGLGSDMVTQAYQSGDNTLSLPGLQATKQVINVVIDENFQISQILGMPVHGLIGMNVFKDYVVRVDYDLEEITLYKPGEFEYKPRKDDIVLPVEFVRNKPVVRAEIRQDSITSVPVSLLVDTGASDALWLSSDTHEQLKIPEVNIYSFLGMGIGGELYGHKGRIDGLWLGGKVIELPIVAYPEPSFIDQIVKAERRNGTIGGEVLRRFTVWFDYFNNRVILRPNNHIKDKFHYNMSGLELINPVPGVPVFTVNNVIENSPAWDAGIRVNDQLISINHRRHNDLSLNDLNLMLRQKDNKRINLVLLRNGEEFKTTFYLKEVL